MKEIKALSKILKEKFDISFNNEALLMEAMTHSSYANEHKEMKGIYNERIEFLGDAVLELTISDWLFRQFPHFQEGQLTKLRAQIVCEDSLSLLAKECSLNEYLLLGKGETLSGGREKPAILCDVFEAFIGALYLDKGVNEVQRFLNLVVIPKIKNGRYELITDFKTELQEYLQQNGPVHIRYELVKEEGPSHDKTFTVQLIVDGKKYKTASGKTKKAAEQMAAKLTMEELTKSSLS
ncbi:ribonuclease III [Granulicatella adiacens ATCC 49175]|uniref:Ribonuclease 3 n=1 Tax=Granulicatella adiacens ATCC 49175 TaxID=638301 RepID=C8NEF3_9LACT|nr:ribonuclease III [Granulicatella adiacens]EEW38054.1 ribonuclease III [Granulicatella adiacens ATCC 49175]UAK93818.1 ribonuclease III [Granulicatella adiacens]UWP38950.1 ribonuclease III [Granulicatella adiacens ATCC 49175]UXY42224.1 ribonuclease III [Granulicatella adiacens]